MRIAYISMDFGVPVFGQKGCSIHVQEVIRAFRKQGAQVELFTTNLGGDPPSDLHDLPVKHLFNSPTGNSAEREQTAIDLNDVLGKELEQAKPFDLIYERYSLFSHAGVETARTQNIPSLLEVNAPLIEEQLKYRTLHNPEAAEKVAKQVFNTATAVIAVSDGVANYVGNYCNTKEHIHVVPNGVNVERFSPSAPSSFPKNPKVFMVGFVGTLKPWHGVDILIAAFRKLLQKHPNTALLIVGDGPERTHLENIINEFILQDSVTFTGAVSPAEIPNLLTSMDVAVAPYPALEEFYFSPLKIYEYMAAGLPVVASNIGQIPKIIKHQENGLLYPAGNLQALTNALEQIIKDPVFGKDLGQVARQTVETHHSWGAISEDMLKLAQSTQKYIMRNQSSFPIPEVRSA